LATLFLGHRGDVSRAPENTLAAIASALQNGADGVEIDIHLSSDGIPMVIHDTSLARTTNSIETVNTLPGALLGSLDAGSWYDPGFADQGVPTLAQVLTLVNGKALIIAELKSGLNRPEALAAATVQVIREFQAHPWVHVSSFSQTILSHVRQIDPEIHCHCLVEAGMALDTLATDPWWALDVEYPMLNEPEIIRYLSRGGRVVVWTVDTKEGIKHCLSQGVWGVITNDLPLALSLKDGA